MSIKKTLLVTLLLSTTVFSQSSSITLLPHQDATLYESELGNIGNGSGQHIFIGRNNNGDLRRGLIKFDLNNEIPTSAIIDSVIMRLSVTRTQNFVSSYTAHTVTSNWGEGTSDPDSQEGQGTNAEVGDATWTKSFFPDTNWISAGGDFQSDTLAQLELDTVGTYFIKADTMFNEIVTKWLSPEFQNFGIILIGDESKNGTAKQFASSENADSTKLPALIVYYTDTSTFTETESQLPKGFNLGANYPNPFNPETVIPFSLPASGYVELSIYNMLGQKLETLVTQEYTAGEHSVRFSASNLSTGVYIYQISTPFGIQSRKLTLIK